MIIEGLELTIVETKANDFLIVITLEHEEIRFAWDIHKWNAVGAIPDNLIPILPAIIRWVNLDTAFRNHISQIWNLLIETEECFEFSRYLRSPATEAERKYLNSTLGQPFKLMHIVLWKNAVIQLAKLFNNKESDHYNISRLMNDVVNGRYKSIAKLTPQVISEWEDVLQNNKDVIKEIVVLRNKCYAHTDKNHERYLKASTLTFECLMPLFTLLKDVIRHMFRELGSGVYMDSKLYFDKERFSAIHDLAKYMPIKEKAIFNQITGRGT